MPDVASEQLQRSFTEEVTNTSAGPIVSYGKSVTFTAETNQPASPAPPCSWRVELGPAGGCDNTETEIVAVRVRLPLVPVTVTVYEPGVDELIVHVDVPVRPATKATPAGLAESE